MGLFDEVKGFFTGADSVEEATGQLIDENVDTGADALKELAPDEVDGAIDTLGDSAKDLGQS